LSEAWPTWETLNAYMDGELSTAEAAKVARAVAERPPLADQIAHLSRLKATIRSSMDSDATVELPPPARGHRWPFLTAGVLAATLAVALVIAAATFLGGGKQSPLALDLLDDASLVHRSWAEQSRATNQAPISSSTFLPALDRFGADAYVPDLISAELTLTEVKLVKQDDYPTILHLGYSDEKDCRVSLFILPVQRGLTDRLMQTGTSLARTYVWRAGTLSYFLLADGMDPERISLIAHGVFDSTRHRLPLTAETRDALTRNLAKATPCPA